MSGVEVAVAVAIAVGILGIVVPFLPGSVLVAGALLVWAMEAQSSHAWIIFAVAVALLLTGQVVRLAVPGRDLRRAGIPNSTLLLGGLVAVAGFFLIPVVGLPIGFVLGIFLGELRRLPAERAWTATKQALRAVGLSILIEVLAALAAAATWAAALATGWA